MMKLGSLFLSMIFTLGAYAGATSSGGGSGTVCRDASRDVKSVELIDLFEAVYRDSYRLVDEESTVQAQITKALARLNFDKRARELIEESTRFIMNQRDPLPSGVGVHMSLDHGDARATFIREGCPLEQIGYFEGETRKVRINSVLYNKMSVLHRAAFILHEAIYFFVREIKGDTDSAWTRKFIGALFSYDQDKRIRKMLRKKLQSKNPGRHWENIFVLRTRGSKIKTEFVLDKPVPKGATVKVSVYCMLKQRESSGHLTASFEVGVLNEGDLRLESETELVARTGEYAGRLCREVGLRTRYDHPTYRGGGSSPGNEMKFSVVFTNLDTGLQTKKYRDHVDGYDISRLIRLLWIH